MRKAVCSHPKEHAALLAKPDLSSNDQYSIEGPWRTALSESAREAAGGSNRQSRPSRLETQRRHAGPNQSVILSEIDGGCIPLTQKPAGILWRATKGTVRHIKP